MAQIAQAVRDDGKLVFITAHPTHEFVVRAGVPPPRYHLRESEGARTHDTTDATPKLWEASV